MATSGSMSTDGGTAEEGATTEDGTSTEWHGESEGETESQGDKACFLGCEEVIDCCDGDSYCEDSLGEYPYNWGCERGLCTHEGCNNDEQCTFGGALPDWRCVDIDGFGACLQSCTTQDDCSFLDGWTCDEDVCMWPPVEPETCENDADCDDGLVCAPLG